MERRCNSYTYFDLIARLKILIWIKIGLLTLEVLEPREREGLEKDPW